MNPSSAVIFRRLVNKIQLVGLISYVHRATCIITYLEHFLTINATVSLSSEICLSYPQLTNPLVSIIRSKFMRACRAAKYSYSPGTRRAYQPFPSSLAGHLCRTRSIL
jgi:hypothetical protein